MTITIDLLFIYFLAFVGFCVTFPFAVVLLFGLLLFLKEAVVDVISEIRKGK